MLVRQPGFLDWTPTRLSSDKDSTDGELGCDQACGPSAAPDPSSPAGTCFGKPQHTSGLKPTPAIRHRYEGSGTRKRAREISSEL